MNISLFSFKCMDTFSFQNCFFSCKRKPASLPTDTLIFLRLPDNIDSKLLANKLIHDSSFNMVINTNKKFVSVSKSNTISTMFNLNLEIMLNKNVNELEKYGSDPSVVKIFTSLVDDVLTKNKFNGFVMQKNDKKYIVCAYPILGRDSTVGIYVIKHNYTNVLFRNDFFQEEEEQQQLVEEVSLD